MAAKRADDKQAAPVHDWAVQLQAFKARLGVPVLVDEVAEALALLDARTLVRWLGEERPSVQAVLLCLAPRAHLAMLVGSLPEAARTDAFLVLGNLKGVSDDALEALKEEAASRFARASRALASPGAPGRRLGDHDPRTHAAALLQGLEPGFADAVLEGVATRDPGLATRLRRDLLTVPRLAELFASDRRTLLCALPEAMLCVFLHGARRLHGEPVAKAFLDVFSKSRREDLEDRLACLGKVRQADVEAAFRAAIEKAVALKADGSISFPWEDTWVS